MQRHSDKHVFLRNPEILHSEAIPSQKPHNDDPFALGATIRACAKGPPLL